jgi:hypothetical protein
MTLSRSSKHSSDRRATSFGRAIFLNLRYSRRNPVAVVEDIVVRPAAGEAQEDEVLMFFEEYGYMVEDVRLTGDSETA